MSGEIPRGRWLNPAGMAKMAGMSLNLVYKHLHHRTIPWKVYPKVGVTSLQWIADSEDVQDYLKNNATGGKEVVSIC
jgi:predicted DNA-binding transcriptional regulator AlpA